MDDLSKLRYLERCFLESMRLIPPIPLILRELREPLPIDDHHVLDAGLTIAIPIWSIHRSPKLYPNPTIFDPDRFLKENIANRHFYSFIPFSMGARNCIGWKIASMEVKVVLSSILRNFELSTTDTEENLKIIFAGSTKPIRPFKVIYKKRFAENKISDSG